MKVSFTDDQGNTMVKQAELNEATMEALKEDQTQKQIYIFQRLSALSRQLVKGL